MPVTISDVDLGPCPGRVYNQGADRWAVILPGANYGPDAPLLWFARKSALSNGRNVVAVRDSFDRSGDPQAWVEQRALAALAQTGTDPYPVLIAKSLTTLTTGLAAGRSLPSVWLTPLVANGHPMSSAVVAGLVAATAPCLLVGGTADESWDGSIARSVRAAEVLEIDGGDHVLEVPGNARLTFEALEVVTNAIDGFLSDLAQVEQR